MSTDDEETANLKFSRTTDNAQITLKPELSLDSDSPHQIQDDFVSEGFFCVGQITRSFYMKGFVKNYEGIGAEHQETVLEPVPMLLIAETNNGQAWMDAKRRIVPQEPMFLGGKSRNWKAPSSDYKNLMPFGVANKICLADPSSPIDFQKTIEMMRDEIRRLFWMDAQASTVLSLWIAGTYVHQAFSAFPYVWLNGLKGTAKTSILEWMEKVAYHAKMSSSMTKSALFRSVDETQATILCDEAETLLVSGKDQDQSAKEKVALFNAGYKQGATVTCSEAKGEKFVVRSFSAYSPKAMASISPIQDTLQSRSLIFTMLKAMDGKYSTQLVNEEKCREIGEQLYHFRFQDGVKMRSDATDQSAGITLSQEFQLKNREWEIFKPILFLAKHLTPDWMDDVKSFIEDQKQIQAIDNRLSNEAQICVMLYEKAVEGENAPRDAKDTIFYGEFLKYIKETDPSLKWVHPKTLGNILRKAGLGKLLSKWGKGAVIRLDKNAIGAALERLGVTDVDEHLSKPEDKDQAMIDHFEKVEQ
jgi:hypothetical protein